MSTSTGVSTSMIVTSLKAMTKQSVVMSDLAYVAVGAFVAQVIDFFCMNFAHGRVGTRLKKAYFDSLMDQEIGYFDMKRTGQLINDMTEAMELIQETYANKLGELATHAFTGVGVTIAQKLINRINGQAANISNEVVSAMRTIRSMDGEEREKKRFFHKLLEIHKVYLFKAAVIAGTVPFAIFFNYGNIALGFWFGGTLVVKGEITLGIMFQVYGYILMSTLGIANGLKILPEFGKASQNIRDLLKVIRRHPLMNPSGGLQPEKVVGHIEFKNVTFSYPTRPNTQVLKNFNLSIHPGQAVALVGASGSGKSTIVGLLEKFYQADSGQIILDGNDLNEIDPRWLHRNIGIVTQEPTHEQGRDQGDGNSSGVGEHARWILSQTGF